jgi:hypothetical protein
MSSALYRMFGEAAQALGRANEARLLEAVEYLRERHAWILGVRQATREEDSKGIDLVVTTDVGELYLQSKSSKTAAVDFMQKRRKLLIATVVVRGDKERVAGRALTALTDLRLVVLEKRKKAR